MAKMTLSQENALITSVLSDQSKMAEAVRSLGYNINKEFKFSRRDENTPSCLVNKDGTWHDYGDGVHGDWAALYMEKNSCSFREAVKKGLSIFDINIDTGISSHQFIKPNFSTPSKKPSQNENDAPLEKRYIQWFLDGAKKHPVRYTNLCRFLMPFATPAEIKKAQWWFKIGYDAKKDRLTIPVRNKEGEYINLFKYTPFSLLENVKYQLVESKRMSLKVTDAPNAVYTYNDNLYKRQLKVKYLFGRTRSLFNLEVLKYKPKVLYVLEGEKDVVNATVAKKAAVTQGGAGMWKEEFAQDLLNACIRYKLITLPRIIIIQDHDKMGLEATIKIHQSLSKKFPNVKMAFWKNITAEYVNTQYPEADIGVIDESIPETVIPLKFDYTDYEVYRKRCS